VADEQVSTGLLVAEGVETTLSAGRGFQPAWSTLDASGLKAFPPLGGVEALTIVADRDPAGEEATAACAARWLAAGCEVRIWRSPAEGQDFADFATEAAA
jgi:putative DNA primase/helicase